MYPALLIALGAEILEEIKTVKQFLVVLILATIFGAVVSIVLGLVTQTMSIAGLTVSVTMVQLVTTHLTGAFFGIVIGKLVRYIKGLKV